MSKMENRVAIVTGAASGMGKAIAKCFLKEGCRVVGFSLESNCDIQHENFSYHSGDIQSYEQVKIFVDTVYKEYGKIDALVNSAGITREGTLETTSSEEFQLAFGVNTLGTFHMCKATIGYLKKQPSTIVNISSNMAIKAIPERIAYNPSKAAVNMLTECIAVDYAPMVRANTVMPGIVKTPMIEKRLDEAEEPEALLKLYASFYPLERIGEVQDITKAVLFLSTAESDWMTGTHLPVCGGDQL